MAMCSCSKSANADNSDNESGPVAVEDEDYNR